MNMNACVRVCVCVCVCVRVSVLCVVCTTTLALYYCSGQDIFLRTLVSSPSSVGSVPDMVGPPVLKKAILEGVGDEVTMVGVKNKASEGLRGFTRG